MALDRITQITSSGISSTATITVNAVAGNITGVVTATTLSVSGNVTSGLNITGGSVGIGTDNPDAPLTIQESGDVQITLKNSSGVTKAYLGTAGAFGSGSTDDLRIRSEGNILFGSVGSEKLRITSSGNLGIGTDNPQEDLHIGGNSPYILLDDYDNFRKWRLKGTAWFAIEDTTAGEDRLRILSNGNVGINTDNPDAKLHVVQPSTLASSLTWGATAGQILRNENSEFAFGLLNTSPFPLWIQGRTNQNVARDIVLNPLGGNIGIGTDNPGAKFHVSGGNIKVDSGYGIDFSATANGSGTTNSELLDDYEEGTFTLTASASSGVITTYGASGRYTRVGRMVHVNIIITISDQGTANGAYLNFQGLPFTSANTFNQVGVAREQSINGYLSTAQVTGNSTSGQVLRYDNSGVIVNGGNWQMSIVYEAQ